MSYLSALEGRKEVVDMAENPKCPFCGFTSHPSNSNDGKTISYICERCKEIFTVKK